jgi:hypothetical protein
MKKRLPHKAVYAFPCLVIALFLFSCAAVPRAGFSGQRDIAADFAGLVHAGSTNTQEEYDYLGYMGISWVLNTFYWNSIEPEQGKWDFSRYDPMVDSSAAAGIKIMGILAYDNRWIHADGKNHDYVPPERLPDYLEYVRKTVERYKGKVGAWCIWNEPNTSFWAGPKKEYYQLASLAASAVREIDSEVILLGGSFNRGIFGLQKSFIKGLFEYGAMEKTDGAAFHPYELNPARTARLYDEFKKTVGRYGFGDKIWVTEIGYPTGGWYPTKVSEKKFPAYIIKTSVLLTARGTQKLFWYQMFDPVTRNSKNSENYFGLLRSDQDYTSKGAEAFRLCAKYLSGTSYTQEIIREGLPNSLRSFYFEGAGGSVLILWNEGPGAKAVHLQLSGTGHETHDPVSGKAEPIAPETAVKAGSMPVFITWQNHPASAKPVLKAAKKKDLGA